LLTVFYFTQAGMKLSSIWRKIPQSVKHFSIELLIVFIGVYGAFSLNNYNESVKTSQNRIKVYHSLSEQVRDLNSTFSSIASYHDKANMEFKNNLQNESFLVGLEHFRYIAPQYSVEVIENALRYNTFEILDLEMHNLLGKFYSEIQMLIYVEQKITETSEKFVFLDPANLPARKELQHWSYTYLEDRKSILKHLESRSAELLAMIEDKIRKE